MRIFILLTLLFYNLTSTSQNPQDTTISKFKLDSLEEELFKFKDIIRKGYFMQLVENNTSFIDTVYSHKNDTLFVFNYGKNQTILRKQIFNIDSHNCKTSLSDIYSDTTGKILYEENWAFRCNLEPQYNGFLQSRNRYHYDNLGNESGMTIEFWNGGGHRVRKVNYTVDKIGNKIWGDRYYLTKYSFWD